MRHIFLATGLKMMIKFGLKNLRTSSTNGLKSYQKIEKLSELLQFLEVLFIIDEVTANKDLDKRRQPLLELSISDRHRGHYLWLLTQSYKSIPKKLRQQAKAIFVWYPKARIDLKTIRDENDVLTDDKLVVARNFLKSQGMVACIYKMKFLVDLVC